MPKIAREKHESCGPNSCEPTIFRGWEMPPGRKNDDRMEFAVFMGLIALAILFRGGGRYSLDSVLSKEL
jgi:uncharacterized membrane protein YphA (DoxX/SURF4 family)